MAKSRRARKKARPRFSFPSKHQRFECRDCPARCCQHWSVQLTAEEVERLEGEDWVRERLGEVGLQQLARRGELPMKEQDRRLQCLFLDDELLCSLQKRFGHDFLPRPCQAFPFGFVETEDQKLAVQLSRMCPPIRESYGEPLAPQLPSKLEQAGRTERMSTVMGTLQGLMLSQPQYLRIAAQWRERLAGPGTLIAGLADLRDWMQHLEDHLSMVGNKEKIADEALDEAMQGADEAPVLPLAGGARPSFHARLLVAHYLGNLCYPARVAQPQRVGGSFWHLQRLRAFLVKLQWMLGWGTVDLLFVEHPVPLGRIDGVARFLEADEAERVRAFLLEILDRRQVFVKPRQLFDVLLDLTMATALISRFARASAASEGRTRVAALDVEEGIGVADLTLLYNSSLRQEGRLMTNLRRALLTDRASFRRLLASEA